MEAIVTVPTEHKLSTKINCDFKVYVKMADKLSFKEPKKKFCFDVTTLHQNAGFISFQTSKVISNAERIAWNNCEDISTKYD